MTRATLLVCLSVLVIFTGRQRELLAQNQPVSLVPFEALAGDVKAAASSRTLDEKKRQIAASLAGNTQELAIYALGTSVYSALVEQDRLDKQIGTSAAAPGSTTLVSHGSVPTLLGLAIESGALYESASGNVVTLRLNPAGLARAMANHSYLLSAPSPNSASLEKVLDRLSASGSFDFAHGSSPGVFTADRSQLIEAAIRYDIINKRDPRHRSHTQAVQHLSLQMQPLVSSLTTYFTLLKQMPGYDAWLIQTSEILSSVNVENDVELRSALFETGDQFASRFGSNSQLQALDGAIVAGIRSYRTVRDEVFQDISRSSALTFEYVFNKPVIPDAAIATVPVGTRFPDLSTARLILSSPVGSIGEATVNGSVSFFNSTLAQMRGNLRDVQIAASLDLRLPEIQGIGKPVLTFAGLGAFLHQQPFGLKLKLRDVETTDGRIGVFQTKLTFPAGGSGLQIPISFTVANRSEFNTEKEVRGSIGMTFDLDKLFARQ